LRFDGRAAVAVLLASFAAGCQYGTLSPEDFELEYGAFSSVPYVGQSLFSPGPAAELRGRLESLLGGRIRATTVTVYANRVMLRAFDPRHPEELNTYFYADGELQKPQPFPASATSAREAFDLEEIPLDRLPEMVERTRREFSKLRGVTPYVAIGRSGARSSLRITVYCSAPRGSGHLEFDTQTRLLGRQ